MSNHTFKSLELYLQGVVDSINYSDFAPPYNDHRLELFSKLLSLENVYWVLNPTQNEVKGWHLFLEIKSCKKWAVKTKIAFKLRRDFIRVAVINDFKELYSSYYGLELYAKDIWLDHEILHKGLCDVFRKALEHANRENEQDSILEPLKKQWSDQ